VGVIYITLRENIITGCKIIFPLRDVLFPKIQRIFPSGEYRTGFIPPEGINGILKRGYSL